MMMADALFASTTLVVLITGTCICVDYEKYWS